jgi:mycothiol synthase
MTAVEGATDLTFRPATLDDAAFAADVFTAISPDYPQDPKMQRHRWESEDADPTWLRERFVVERDGRPVGIGIQSHAQWDAMPTRYGFLHAELLPELRTPERMTPLWDFVEGRAREAGTEIFSAWARENDPFRIEFLEARGYHRERAGKAWELDLFENRDRLTAMAPTARARMREAGIRILPLADDDDPERYRKLWQVVEEAIQDVPTTVPHVPIPFEAFTKWLRAPGTYENRVWIARDGDAIVGVSLLQYPPVRGMVTTAWTGTSRSVRGKGVARALKLETVLQAIALGVDRVATGNDSENAPILHLNEEMGYRRVPGWIQLLKERER